VEAFQANPKYLTDITFNVPKLGLTGFRLEFRRLGQVILSMDEDFEDIPEGMLHKVTMTIGNTAPVLSTVTRLVRQRLLGERLDAWHLHNVQEVGNLAHFLPDLYAAHTQRV
jgi:hypothetical protein